MVPNKIPPRLKRRHAQLAFRRHSLPPLLFNAATQNHDGLEPLLVFGPDGAMFLPAGPPDKAQSPQLIPLASSLPDDTAGPSSAASQFPSSALQVSPSTPNSGLSVTSQAGTPLASAALSLSLSQAVSLTSDGNSFTSALTPRPTQTPSASSEPSYSTYFSNTLTTGPSQSPTPSQIQGISSIVIATTSSVVSQSPTTSSTQDSGTLFHQSSLSSTPATTSATSSSALASASSTPAATNSDNLPHLAEIVLGVVAAISLVAIIATLVSWFYKQRKRRNEHAEIVSLNSSAYESGRGGLFGFLKKRPGKSTEDLSELGFGLSHVGFFGAPNSGDDDHRAGLSLGPENVLSEEEERQYAYKDPKKELSLLPPQVLFPSDGFTDSAYPPMRPFHESIRTPADGASSMSLSPSRYQHLGRTNATPLIVANLTPGDVSGDEDGNRGVLPAARCGSLGTPRMGDGVPPFTRLDGEGLAVPWAPLNVKPHHPGGKNDSAERLFEPLELSRTSTLSMAFSRTSSRRLGHSFSKTADWRDGVTHPPQGTFGTAWDQTTHEPVPVVSGLERGTWATTIRANFYNALNAMGNYGGKGEEGRSKASSVSTLPNPYSDSSRHSSMRFPFSKPQRAQMDVLENTLTPSLPRVARRSKGSIIRGNLGIEAPVHVGLGIDALSRSSTFSTSWSDAEKASDAAWVAQHIRVLDRDLGRTHLVRTGSGSTASSLSREVTTFKRVGPGRGPRISSMRPRYSRMPVSQSSVWSSESYSSSIVKGKAEIPH